MGLTLKKHPYLFVFASLLLLSCTSVVQDYDSPNFDRASGRFQHSDGDKHNKSFVELFGLAFKYFSREYDAFEERGFPVVKSSKGELEGFNENVMWVGHASILINHGELTVLTDP